MGLLLQGSITTYVLWKNASRCSLQCTDILLVIEEAHTGILPQGVPPTQTQFSFQTIRCTGCRATLQNVKKTALIFLKPVIFKPSKQPEEYILSEAWFTFTDICISKLECLYFKPVNKYYSTTLDPLQCTGQHIGSSSLYLYLYSTLIKNRLIDDGVPAILQYRSSDLYLTDRKETMAILQKNTHTPLILARCTCDARNIKILWVKRMNEGRPYLKMWRGVWASICKISIVSFLSIRYKSDDLYCRMTGTPSSPARLYRVKKTLFFIIIYVIYIPLDFSYV